MALSYNADEPQYPQQFDWSCSACSLAWLNRALGIDYATDEYTAIEYIGNPEHINMTYGLMDGSGSRLVQCLRQQGAPAFNFWPDFGTAYQLAAHMPLLIGGVGWYHWVGVRTAYDSTLFIANSAQGWQGVYNTLNEVQWDSLGPFAVVAVPLLIRFPPSQPA